MLVELTAGGAGLQLLEPVRQLERVGIDERELLLDRDREIRSRFEGFARNANLFLRAESLAVPHLASVNEAMAS